MRLLLPILMVTLGFPAFALQSEAAKPGPTHIVQELRPGKGQTRVRDTSKARAATPRTAALAQGTERIRTYQVAKPGEGAPKT